MILSLALVCLTASTSGEPPQLREDQRVWPEGGMYRDSRAQGGSGELSRSSMSGDVGDDLSTT